MEPERNVSSTNDREVSTAIVMASLIVNNFYVINTSNKSSPAFLSANADGHCKKQVFITVAVQMHQMYPRRSLTRTGWSESSNWWGKMVFLMEITHLNIRFTDMTPKQHLLIAEVLTIIKDSMI